jgi:hypothetical protein
MCKTKEKIHIKRKILPKSYDVKIQSQGILVSLDRIYFSFLWSYHGFHTELWDVSGRVSQASKVIEERRALHFMTTCCDCVLTSLTSLEVKSCHLCCRDTPLNVLHLKLKSINSWCFPTSLSGRAKTVNVIKVVCTQINQPQTKEDLEDNEDHMDAEDLFLPALTW